MYIYIYIHDRHTEWKYMKVKGAWEDEGDEGEGKHRKKE